MPRAKILTEFEKGRIIELWSSGLSSQAAKSIKRSKTVVHNFSQLSDNYGEKISGGRTKALSSSGERRVFQRALTGKYSSTEIIN